MPVECDIALMDQGKEAFHAIDRDAMRHAFDLHNTIGRFLDEDIYQAEMAHRLKGDGYQVRREVKLRAIHRNFHKDYFLDLVVNDFAIYELKTVEKLDAVHESQLIHYLLLANMKNGKLVNFRPSSVQSRFVSTTFTKKERTNFIIDDADWAPSVESAVTLRQTLCDLLADWGTCLSVDLYHSALLDLVSAPEGGLLPVDIVISGKRRGTKMMCLLDSSTTWHISALPTPSKSYRNHLTRLLHHTPLQTLHWINLHQNIITLKTLEK